MSATQLVPEVVCPNCWQTFPPEEVCYVATEPSLFGDRRLGSAAAQRFLPSRFHPDGRAIDPRGGLCHETACPNCHLEVPRPLLESPALFASVFGSPASGKSYLLAAMTHQLRRTLPRSFAVNFSDADPRSNAFLHHYENTLFDDAPGDGWVALAKTDVSGDRYRSVDFGGHTLAFPQPHFFQVSPVAGHPHESDPASVARTLCLYDNAGESFEPGREAEDSPVTRHMASARGLVFVFDPTQETSFRAACRERSTDPQWADERRSRQATLFSEAMSRILRFRSLQPTDRVDTPLVVILPKYDAWSFLLGDAELPSPFRDVPLKDGGAVRVFDAPTVRRVSDVCREMLAKHAAPMLTRIEERSDPSRLTFVPVSATGCGPAGIDEADGKYYHRAGDIAPIWVETPLLALLHGAVPELVPSVRS